MKITLTKTWITDPSCPTPGNPRVADDFRLRGYFLTYEQAEKILAALMSCTYENAECGGEGGDFDEDAVTEAIFILTGERE